MSQTRFRSATFDVATRAAADTVTVTLSTDAPLDRGDYVEVLDHSSAAIDLSRAEGGLPLIEGHDLGRLPIARIVNLRTDGHRLRGQVKFGTSQRAADLKADVAAGIVTGVSIGYEILDHKTDGNVITATRWKPYEASAVAVPADQAAGFYRSRNSGATHMPDENTGGEAADLSRSQRRAANRNDDANQERITAIRSICRTYERYLGDDGKAFADRLIETGGSPETLTDFVMTRMHNSSAQNPVIMPMGRGDHGIDSNDLRKYSLLRAIRAAAFGKEKRSLYEEAAFEMEVSRTIADKAGLQARGFMVPRELFVRDLSVGGATAGQTLVGVDHRPDQFIPTLDVMPQVEAMGAMKLTGLVGNIDIPRMTAGSAPQWLSAENGTYTETEPTLGTFVMSPKDVAGLTDITRRLIQQSSPAVEMLVRQDLTKRIIAAIDLAAINGSGASGVPRGILNAVGIGSVAMGANGGAPTWAAITQLIQAVGAANGLDGALGFLTNAKVQGTLLRTEKSASTGLYCWEPGRAQSEGQIAGYRALVSNNVPSNLVKGTSGAVCSALIFGNFQDLLIGYWGGLDVTVDPYTFSSTGMLRITAIQSCDVLVRRTGSFAAIADALTT